MRLRLVAGRPVSAVTIDFLAWCAAQRAAQGCTALRLIWDHASWHRRHAVRHWLRQHNPQVKQGAEGVRIVGLDYKDDPGRARSFLDRNGDPFAVILADTDGGAGLDLGVSGVPETFLVSPSGQIIAKYTGALSPQQADALMRKAAEAR